MYSSLISRLFAYRYDRCKYLAVWNSEKWGESKSTRAVTKTMGGVLAFPAIGTALGLGVVGASVALPVLVGLGAYHAGKQARRYVRRVQRRREDRRRAEQVERNRAELQAAQLKEELASIEGRGMYMYGCLFIDVFYLSMMKFL